MTSAERAQLRKLAEANLAVPHLAESERGVLALLTDLDAMERIIVELRVLLEDVCSHITALSEMLVTSIGSNEASNRLDELADRIDLAMSAEIGR